MDEVIVALYESYQIYAYSDGNGTAPIITTKKP